MALQSALTPDQIAQARTLRATGKGYAEIAADIGTDIDPDSIRAHCLDVPVEGGRAPRVDKPVRERADGGTIRSYSEAEDDRLMQWCAGDRRGFENLNQLAKDMGRKWHSVTARIKTLRRHGKIPPE